jgi:hypothetical protein
VSGVAAAQRSGRDLVRGYVRLTNPRISERLLVTTVPTR